MIGNVQLGCIPKFTVVRPKFILGNRMRLVSEFRKVIGNPTIMGKCIRLMVRYASFNHLTIGHPNNDIMMLDYEAACCRNSRRRMVVGTQSVNTKTPGNLFHVIGQDWKGRYAFNFLKHKVEEDIIIVDDGILLLVHSHIYFIL